MKPRLLDLFCCAGGCSMGYARAGFDVTGVDIAPQPHYPFRFVRADALDYLAQHGHEFDAIHASPPCQEYSASRHIRNQNSAIKGYAINRRPMLIEPVRDALIALGKPWILENVSGAPMPSAILLCGSMFGLPIRRHRLFESSHLFFAPGPCQHASGFYNILGAKIRGYGDFASDTSYISKGAVRRRERYYRKDVGCSAFGIEWMTVAEMSEAIPPAYTEWIGRQLLEAESA